MSGKFYIGMNRNSFDYVIVTEKLHLGSFTFAFSIDSVKKAIFG